MISTPEMVEMVEINFDFRSQKVGWSKLITRVEMVEMVEMNYEGRNGLRGSKWITRVDPIYKKNFFLYKKKLLKRFYFVGTDLWPRLLDKFRRG
jgi:hypothetical protein